MGSGSAQTMAQTAYLIYIIYIIDVPESPLACGGKGGSLYKLYIELYKFSTYSQVAHAIITLLSPRCSGTVK